MLLECADGGNLNFDFFPVLIKKKRPQPLLQEFFWMAPDYYFIPWRLFGGFALFFQPAGVWLIFFTPPGDPFVKYPKKPCCIQSKKKRTYICNNSKKQIKIFLKTTFTVLKKCFFRKDTNKILFFKPPHQKCSVCLRKKKPI